MQSSLSEDVAFDILLVLFIVHQADEHRTKFSVLFDRLILVLREFQLNYRYHHQSRRM